MGKRKRRVFPKKKRSVFRRPHPMRRKIMIRHRRVKAFFHKHNPKMAIERGVRRMVGGIYTVSDKLRDKIAESTLALDNPFSAQFYEDRFLCLDIGHTKDAPLDTIFSVKHPELYQNLSKLQQDQLALGDIQHCKFGVSTPKHVFLDIGLKPTMLPYPRGLILDNSNNYGIVKTETLIGFGRTNRENYENEINTTEPLKWIFTHENFAPRSLKVSDSDSSRKYHATIEVTTAKPRTHSRKNTKKSNKHVKKKIKRKAKGVKKCIVKFLNKGDGSGQGGGGKRHKRRRNKFHKMQKRYMLPLILGLLAAKSLLIPIALKALAFLSAKGLMMGFFSTVMASVLSLKGMFDHSHGYQNRKDDTKTQVEIIQVPSKTEDHLYYDDHYRRGDYAPVSNII